MMEIPDKVKRKLEAIPDKPGCYIMRDRRGRIIYVGKAASLRKRVQSYFRQATRRRADPKLSGLLHSVADLDYLVVRSEAEALLTEGQLIKDYRPRYNVSFRDDKRFLLLRIDPGEAWPMFTVVRLQREDGAAYFGPYASSAAARATMDFANKRFGLRRCRHCTPGSGRPCIHQTMRYRDAPDMAAITRAAYMARVEQGCAFLRGELPQYLEEMRAAMEAAAQAQDFEEAAALRDTLLMLRAVVGQRARVASTPALRTEEARAGLAELERALELTRVPRVIECYDISNISGTLAVASMVCAIDGMPHPNRYRRFRIRTVHSSDDPAMMAEVIQRRFARLLREHGVPPDLLIVDGGITQLRAAQAELWKLGVKDVAIAGLAKRFEEIYVPGRLAPVRLPGDSRALRVLQRMRDEAHRFALQYHRRLRARLMRESVIDDVPGIGRHRKELLLQHFGSVDRMKRATEADLAAVPGVGVQLAREIREKLKDVRGPQAEDRGRGGADGDEGPVDE
jgi:excinuclease ABC subunit C